MFKSKRIYDLSIVELKKKSKMYNTMFWLYVIIAIVVGVVNGLFTIPSINGVMSMEKDASFFFLLSLVLISVNTLMIVFLWFISESSYYKMLQLNADMMIYFKGKLGE